MQECGAGLVELRQEGGMLSFAAPPLRRTGPLDEDLLSRLVAASGISEVVSRGHRGVVAGAGVG